jgi:hypothetical protein
LANEQIELIRNLRDSNYNQIKKFNQINPASADYDNVSEYFKDGEKYIIENDYSDTAIFPIKVTDITA